MHSFTYDFHLRAVCAYVADRQLLFTPGYHLSSFLSDFIKYYNKGPNFARNLIYSGELTVEDTGSPGEQLYNYLLAREKQYKMRVLRMTPVILDPTADMQYTEFVLVHTKTCRVHYSDANDQRVSDDYDVTLLVSHNATLDAHPSDQQLNVLHLNFYVILTSRREMYPNRSLKRKGANSPQVNSTVLGHWKTATSSNQRAVMRVGLCNSPPSVQPGLRRDGGHLQAPQGCSLPHLPCPPPPTPPPPQAIPTPCQVLHWDQVRFSMFVGAHDGIAKLKKLNSKGAHGMYIIPFQVGECEFPLANYTVLKDNAKNTPEQAEKSGETRIHPIFKIKQSLHCG
ncbi:KICSTOR complex protein SZT2-like [Penaeus monodon]|uniref:KICSTOR complex protein SZT2-like n=1 Tax=Penaeus monodon TaxID=6687 RepID=UPI0018A7B6DB|nr:KICSTOR complex protein SZT2-like [Penaeus monodon]